MIRLQSTGADDHGKPWHATLVRHTSGKLRIEGIDIREEPENARRHIGFLSHNTYLYRDLTPVEMTARIDAVYFGGATSVTSCAPGSAECTVEETCSINPKKINFIPPDKPQLGKPYQCNIDCVGPACNID